MVAQIVVLGGGTGGTLTANRLRRELGDDAEITVVDQDDRHVYQPGLLFVPFGLAHPDEIVRPRNRQLHDGITFRQCGIDRVEITDNTVHLADGSVLPYDVLVVATGAALVPEETEGLTGPGWMEKVFTFYSLEGAAALAAALAAFDGGRLVVNVVDMPIKCPVAPLEFCFLADWYFHERGIRDRVQITYVTPLDGAFTKPVASRQLAGMLAEKGIELITEFNTGEVDGAGGRLVGYDGREVAVRPGGGRAAPRWRRLRRPVTWPRRRAELRADRRAHAAVQGRRQRLRDRRRGERPGVEGRVGDPLRRRDASSTTCGATSPANPSWTASTGTPTASSRPASTRRC